MKESEISEALLAIPNKGTFADSTRIIDGVRVIRTGEGGWQIGNTASSLTLVLGYFAEIKEIKAAILAIPNIGTFANSTRTIRGVEVVRTGECGWIIDGRGVTPQEGAIHIFEHHQGKKA